MHKRISMEFRFVEAFTLPCYMFCADIDECSAGLLNCSGECVNYNGGAYCRCESGYRANNDGECIGE